MKKNNKDISTKEKILKYAIQEFIEYGRHGARMQRIADRAGINKALLFYYYSNKDEIYKQVLTDVFQFVLENLNKISDEPKTIEEMISSIFDVYVIFFNNYPNYWHLVAYELSQGGSMLKKIVITKATSVPINPRTGKIYLFFKEKIKAGEIKDINIHQLFVSIIGQILPIYIARPILDALGIFKNIAFNLFIKQRKQFIISLICDGIKLKK